MVRLPQIPNLQLLIIVHVIRHRNLVREEHILILHPLQGLDHTLVIMDYSS